MKFFKDIDRELAWSVTQHFLIAISGIGLLDFIVTAHAYFVIVAVRGSSATWAVLYKLEEGVRAKWQKKQIKSLELFESTERTVPSLWPKDTYQN